MAGGKIVVATVLASALLLAAASLAQDGALSDAERRGREIYFTGVSPSGQPIIAYFGAARNALPAEALTCGNCHGHDGRGRPEGGMLPPNITWRYLTKSYGHEHANGTRHAPFTEAGIKHFLRTGVYPGGSRGDPAMPTFDLSDRDIDDLLAFLKRLGELRDAGLGDASIKIGTLIPRQGRLSATGAVITALLTAYFSDLNAAGGIYGRKIELVTHALDLRPGPGSLATLKDWLAEEQPFALVGTFTPTLDTDIQSAAAAQGVPVIGPVTLYPRDTFSLRHSTFYLLAGISQQVQALLQYADKHLQLSKPRVAIFYPENPALAETVNNAKRMCQAKHWPMLREITFPAGAFDAASIARELRLADIDIVISLGIEHELHAFLRSALNGGWSPYVLAPGILSGGIVVTAPAGWEKRLYLAYPTLPQDRKHWALNELAALMKTHRIDSSQHTMVIVAAYSSAKVLVEAMRRAGRNLGRRELIAVLEKFYRFETGLTPPITFSRNRRIGAKGAYVFGLIRQQSLPESVRWIELD
jgi:ABC-type branched-subunit amino acid transport system substrate-binding protein